MGTLVGESFEQKAAQMEDQPSVEGWVVPTPSLGDTSKFPSMLHAEVVWPWGSWGQAAALVSLASTSGQTHVSSAGGIQPWLEST